MYITHLSTIFITALRAKVRVSELATASFRLCQQPFYSCLHIFLHGCSGLCVRASLWYRIVSQQHGHTVMHDSLTSSRAKFGSHIALCVRNAYVFTGP